MIHREDAPETSAAIGPPKPRRRKHRSRSLHGSSLRGKISLIAMFFMLRALDVFILVEWPAVNKSEVFFSIINHAIWTTALLAAIWFRKGWARYVLIFFMPLGILAALILLPDFWIKFEADNRLVAIFSATLIVQGTVAWLLIFSRDLERLTGRGKG